MKRKFGNTTVTISYEGRIAIIGDWTSNYGVVYGHQIQAFNAGEQVQVIGMDAPVSAGILKWVYGRIQAGKFKHLGE